MEKVTIYRDAVEEEIVAIQTAIEILSEVGLELIGTRPKTR